MLTRLCIILAIVAGLAALAITHLQVDKKIKDVIGQRDQNGQERDAARTAQKTAEDERDKTKKDLDATTVELTSTKGMLEEKTKAYDDAEKRVTKLGSDLKKADSDKKSMQEELSPWRALGKTPDVVKTTLASNARALRSSGIETLPNPFFAMAAHPCSKIFFDLRQSYGAVSL